MTNTVIVSRHASAIAFIARHMGGKVVGGAAPTHVEMPDGALVPIITGNATAHDVVGRTIYGNIPMQLAACAHAVYALEFAGAPPRGQEYGLEEMDAAGARLIGYTVHAI